MNIRNLLVATEVTKQKKKSHFSTLFSKITSLLREWNTISRRFFLFDRSTAEKLGKVPIRRFSASFPVLPHEHELSPQLRVVRPPPPFWCENACQVVEGEMYRRLNAAFACTKVLQLAALASAFCWNSAWPRAPSSEKVSPVSLFRANDPDVRF